MPDYNAHSTPPEQTYEVVQYYENAAREMLAELDKSNPQGAAPLYDTALPSWECISA